MRILPLVPVAALLLLPACQFGATAHAGYAQMALDGRLGYVSGSSSASFDQDIQSAFGLGDDQGAPYGRVMLDVGVPVIAVSGFMFEEQGTGTLSANFGSNPLLNSGARVNTDFSMANAKASLAFQISLGPVKVSPGLAADYFDLDIKVREVNGFASERVQLAAPVPLGFLRGEVDLGVVSALAEVGYIEIDVEDVKAKLLDLEALVMAHPTSMLDVFVGYRMLALDAKGFIDNNSFDTDLTIGGFLIGGGVRF